jgi:hypothetical protein
LLSAGGCLGEEHALLLAVNVEASARDFEVEVWSVDEGRSLETQRRVMVPIDGEPIRVAVTLPDPRVVAIRLVARDGDGAATHSAFRCYDVVGTVYDTFGLVAITVADNDGDGWPADVVRGCGEPCGAFACPATLADCDDTDDLTNPGAIEVCGGDLDCDGIARECPDEDMDGYPACPPGTQDGDCDCDDTTAEINPGIMEPCPSSVDLNCDGRAGSICDRDGDGFFSGTEVGGVPDCDDTNPMIHPDADEICTEAGGMPVDENCNGAFDEGCDPDDLDGDGVLPAAGDCDDCNPAARPMAVERCGDGIVQNCDTGDVMCAVDDMDGDGVRAVATGGRDCDDTRADVHPSAPEQCDGEADEDCDGLVDEGCPDLDGDGYVEDGLLLPCEGDPTRNPGVSEICDGIDQDCDGIVDEDAPAGTACIRDLDGAAYVVDYSDSMAHCGGCRMPCPGTRADSCVDGVCGCSTNRDEEVCAAGLVCCDGGGADSGCKDFTDDFDNCGACGNACDSETADRCVGRDCRCGALGPCTVGLSCCDGRCVDYLADPNNCSGCNRPCGRRETCEDGYCSCYGHTASDMGRDACTGQDVCCEDDRRCRNRSSC